MASPEQLREHWRGFLSSVFPEVPGDSSSKCHCVPPLHKNKELLIRQPVPGTSENALVKYSPTAMKPKCYEASGQTAITNPPERMIKNDQSETDEKLMKKGVQVSDIIDDLAQKHVVANLHELGKQLQQLVFILSQFDFKEYGRNHVFAAAVKELQATLPLPGQVDDPTKNNQKLSKGESDILIFHRYCGVLIMEIKSVGYSQKFIELREIKVNDVEKRIDKAIGQLLKSEAVVKHLIKDIDPEVAVQKALCLPYISCTQLRRVLELKVSLKEKLCQCLGVSDINACVEVSLCAEQLSDPMKYWKVSDDKLSSLTTWWRRRMPTPDPKLAGVESETVFRDIVARFVIPVCTVVIHSTVPPRVELATAQGLAVAELGNKLSRLVLTKEQMKVLHQNPRHAFITGPPGTGKTVVLYLQALRWLKEGHDVCVISTRHQTLAATFLLENELKETINGNNDYSNAGKIRVHLYDFEGDSKDDKKAVRELNDIVEAGKKLRIIMDETVVRKGISVGPKVKRFIECILALNNFRVWCASAGHDGNIPSKMIEVLLTFPLRSAPSVTREVEKGFQHFKHVKPYTPDRKLPSAGDGPEPIKILHTKREPHNDSWPVDCEACGREVAVKLKKQLGVKNEGRSLQWRDVFIITRSGTLQDEIKDAEGHVKSPACGFVRGLRAEEVPTGVMAYDDYKKDKDAFITKIKRVVRAEDNEVTVTCADFVLGLERRVVVRLVGVWQEGDQNKELVDIDANDRLFCVSRCTTQLIVVDVPEEAGHS